jgi:hypothetical protein
MSTSNATANVPGMMYPTQKAMLAGTPRDSANVAMLTANQNQTTANKLMSGGKIKKTRYFGGDASSQIVVPQYNMLYTPQGGVGTNPNDQIKINSQTSTQMNANSVYDKYASIKGGTRRRSTRRRGSRRRSTRRGGSRRRKGGNPDWSWGCMSGGKHKKSRKH